MSKTIICINFYGHNDPSVAGQPATEAPLGAFWRSTSRSVKRDVVLKVVNRSRIGCPNFPDRKIGVLDFNAALGENANKALAKKVLTSINLACAEDEEQFFLVTGYSSGGVTALHMAQSLLALKLNVYYIGLADAAFQRGESDYLMTKPGVASVKYKKNYYQTKENDPTNPEIHDTVDGFTPFDLTGQVSDGNAHQDAVVIGNQKMLDDVMWCIKYC